MTKEEKIDFINEAWHFPLVAIMLIGFIIFVLNKGETAGYMLIFPAALILFFSFGVSLEVISRWKEIRERDKKSKS